MRSERIVTIYALCLFTVFACDSEQDSGESAAPRPQPAAQNTAEVDTSATAGMDSGRDKEFHPGKKLYARCAACHLPDGSGVPGAFPPLGDNIVALSGNEPGRDYLAKAVQNGIVGVIEIDGQIYSGAMPAHGTILHDEEIADVLNYIFESLNNKQGDAGFKPFTGDEVAQAVARRADLSPNEILNLRNQALEDATP